MSEVASIRSASRYQRLAADGCQALYGEHLVARVGVDAGTDGSTTQVDFGQQLRRQRTQTVEVFGHGGGEGAEFLAQGHRHGVLQLGTAHLQYVVELFTFGSEGLDQAVEAGQQGIVTQQQAQADSGRVGVVGRLRHVHIVVRVQVLVLTLLVAHGLQRDVGDDFVGVHVGRSTSTALDHVHHELLVVVALDQSCAGCADRGVLGIAQVPQLTVGVSSCLLDHRQADYQFRVVRQRNAGEVEVVGSAQGLDAVVGISRNFKGTQQIFFDAERCSGGHDVYHLDIDPAHAGMAPILGLKVILRPMLLHANLCTNGIVFHVTPIDIRACSILVHAGRCAS